MFDVGRKPRIRTIGTVLAVAAVLATAGCGEDSTRDLLAGDGWPGAHSDARNSNTSPAIGPRTLSPAWSRSVGGAIDAGTSISADGQIFLATRAESGCNLLSFQATGRKRLCNGLMAGTHRTAPAPATPIIDQDGNIYIGTTDGTMRSYNYLGQERWVMPVLGVPLSAQFTGDGNVLSLTQLGEVNIFDRQTGKRLVAPTRILGQPDFLGDSNLSWPDNTQGLDDCPAGTAGCPVANSPAIDPKSGHFYLTLWRPGAAKAALLALRYSDGKIKNVWEAAILTDGSAAGPTLSDDGETVYVGDNAGQLLAVDAATGKTRWTRDLGYKPQGGLSVSADGLIIPATENEGKLLALRDRGDHADLAWQRPDLVQTGIPVQTAGDTGYTVIRGADSQPILLTFDTHDGNTVAQHPLSGATGRTVGTAISTDREVVVATARGDLFAFQPRN